MENAVLQSFVNQFDGIPSYWSSGNMAEIDFILQLGVDIIPVEIKSDMRVSGKSLSVYTNKYNPSYRIRFSMNNLKENGGLLSCPIPLVDWLLKIMNVWK